MGIYGVVYALFNALVLYGRCPSLLDNHKYDREASDYLPIKDALQQVDLISHTFRVLDLGLKLLKQDPILYSITTAVIMIIMTLACDICKIYGACSRFARIDHARSSASMLRVLMEPKKTGRDFMYDDILLHHESAMMHKRNVNVRQVRKAASAMMLLTDIPPFSVTSACPAKLQSALLNRRS